MSRLRITDAAGSRDVALDRDALVLGRAPECDVVVDDEGVSREHARLFRGRAGWSVEDLGSRNGTFVSDTRVESAVLAEGDVIRLGPSATLQLLGAATTAAATARGRATRGPAVAAPARAPHLFAELQWTLVPAARGGRRIVLRGPVTTVGRDPGAGLPLDDDSVSRMHARLDREGGSLWVTDLKSRNGTEVNGDPVLRAELAHGDVVRFGEIEYGVERRAGPAWSRIGLLVGALAVAGAGVFGALRLGRSLDERSTVAETGKRVRAEALDRVRKGIAAYRAGELDFAHAHLLYAADLMLLADLAPPGASLDRPGELFRIVARELPDEDREFDFARALDPRAIAEAQVKLESLSNREYVERQTRRFAIELGQAEDVPAGFVNEVWEYVHEYEKYRGLFTKVLQRSRTMHPRLKAILAEEHLPEVFCYVSWIESDLDPQRESPVGAKGLWQFMPSTGRMYGLRIEGSVDDRTDVERSTRAGAKYIGNLIKTFGREQFMCALASYNRGENGVRRAMERIPDPMMESSRKYWYLVENDLLPDETKGYVPKIFAARVVAEAPRRFGYDVP